MTRDELAENFWNNLKTELKRQHMTHKDLAAAIGMNSRTLSSMIFRNTLPDIGFLVDASLALDIDSRTLLYGRSEDSSRCDSLSDKEKAVLDILRSGSKEENDRALGLFVSVIRYSRGHKPCWQWNSRTHSFQHISLPEDSDEAREESEEPDDDDFGNDDDSMTGAV